ncbi:MAG TPA: BMP family ABC transporter substrate-binding protein [Gaiellaceae bacterium]|jgi:basic membrane protein A|nr:BMP family ABC transporter substrate-binding protein [Gaiellaceae bacterium]
MDSRDRDAAELRRAVREGAVSRQELLRRGAALGLSLPTLGALLAACGGDEEEAGETDREDAGAERRMKVGFVYLGPPGDAGWTFQHDEGRKYLEEKLPNIETTAIENVPEANAGPALDQLIAQGNEVIFATSFGYGDAVLQRATQHPDVIFEHCSGYKRAENVATYYGVHWGAMYLIGLVAGRMTRSNRLGFVGSFPIPDVVVDANAFTLGARSVNPNATTRAVLINTWYDPPKETQAARSLIDAGADVLSGVEDSPAILEEAAKHENVYSATWNSDMSRFGPDAFLTAVVWNWGPYYVEQVTKAMEGTWKTHDFWGTPEDGTVELAPLGSSVPDDVRAEFDEKYAALKEGSFNPFVGPIKDSKGKVRVPEGEEMPFDAILRWDWYVEGVAGSLPA